MGTSKPSSGPKGNRNPSPPWPDEPQRPNYPKLPPKDHEPENPLHTSPKLDIEIPPKRPAIPPKLPIPSVSWASPKRQIKTFSDKPTAQNFERVGKGYTKALGGSKSAASSARAGRQVTAALAAFISSGIQNGLAQTAKDFGLTKLVGQDANSAAAEIVDTLAPAGSTIEEAIARAALIETIKDFFSELDIENSGLEVLEQLGAGDVQRLIEISIVNYVNCRLQEELINRIERNTIGGQAANRIARQIKKFISSNVSLVFGDQDLAKINWSGSQGKSIIEDLYRQAYEILGDE